MRLISIGFTVTLQRRYDWLINTFIDESLGSLRPKLNNLTVYAVRGGFRGPAGRVFIARNDRIVITLYKAGLDMQQMLRRRRVAEGLDAKKAFNTFVLLHEVAHIIQAYRDWDVYKAIIESTEVYDMSNAAKEREADQMAADFIKRHRLFPVELIDVGNVAA